MKIWGWMVSLTILWAVSSRAVAIPSCLRHLLAPAGRSPSGIEASQARDFLFREAGFTIETRPLAGLQIQLYRSSLPRAPRGVFVYTHGMTSRSNQHLTLLSFMRQLGFAVVAYDLPGHGASQRFRKSVPGSVYSFSTYLHVLHSLVALLPQFYGKLPLVLSGWSLGGMITARYLQERPTDAHSAIYFAPGVSLWPLAGYPLHRRLNMLLNFQRPLDEIVGIDTEKLVHDKQLARQLREDPGYFALPDILLLRAVAEGYASLDPEKHRTPFLTLIAENDVFTYSSGVRWYFHRAEGTLATARFETFSESYHDLVNDVQGSQVLAAVETYLAQRLP